VSHSDQCKLHSSTLPRSCTQYSSFPNNVSRCLLKSGPAKFLVNMSAGLSHPGNQTVLIIPPSFNSRMAIMGCFLVKCLEMTQNPPIGTDFRRLIKKVYIV
jgi:hypothetical protein